MPADDAIVEPSHALDKIIEAKAKTEPKEDSIVTQVNEAESEAVDPATESEQHAKIVNALSVYHDLDDQS